MPVTTDPVVYDASYHQWRQAATRSGLLFRAVAQYYQEGLTQRGYTYTVAGEPFRVPMVTADSWSPPHTVTGHPEDPAVVSAEDRAVLGEFVKPMAFDGDALQASCDPDEYVWNGAIQGVQPQSLAAAPVHLSPLTYYTAATRFHRLRNELSRALYAAGCSPTATQPFDSDTLHSTAREQLAPTVEQLLTPETPLSVGVSGVCIVNTGDQYELLTARKADTTSAEAGTLAVVPSGFIDADATAAADPVVETVLREFGEEVLGTPEEEHSLKTEGVTQLRALLDGTGATAHTVFAHVNPVKAHTTFSTALVIDDPSFYDEVLSEVSTGGWETATIERLPLDDALERTTVRGAHSFTQNHIPSVIESLVWFESHRPVSLPLSVRGHAQNQL